MIIEDTVLALIRNEQNKEEHLHAIKQLVSKEPYKDYIIENGLLIKKKVIKLLSYYCQVCIMRL